LCDESGPGALQKEHDRNSEADHDDGDRDCPAGELITAAG
jgi:hypothetical protein